MTSLLLLSAQTPKLHNHFLGILEGEEWLGILEGEEWLCLVASLDIAYQENEGMWVTGS